jgi:transcription antitermination factor NusG
MLMTVEKTGNLEQVRLATTPPMIETLHPQRHPFTHWFMVTVRPGRDQEAADSFRRNGIRAYWPNFERYQTVRNRHNGNKPELKCFLTAILPGYLFCPDSPGQESFTSLIERVSGVVNVVRTFSGNPLMLHETDIQIIRCIEAGLNTPSPVKAVHNFKTGEKVRFTDDLMGRWSGGKISKLARDGRISVEVDLMGRRVAVIAYPHQIERA